MVYLDHHAATPLSPGVREAMLAALEQGWANPASAHGPGRGARAMVEDARRTLAQALGAKPADLVFAGSGTEACNLALLGVARAAPLGTPRRVVTTSIEHPAIASAISRLSREGFAVTHLPVTSGAPFSVDALDAALEGGASCAALQWVNHETGNVLPIQAYAEVCARRGVPLVVDACQALGKLDVDVRALGASALVLASSKLGGPAGVSAVWHERSCPLSPVTYGGGQERGLRPGTPSAVLLAGFAAALRGLPARRQAVARLGALRDGLEDRCVALGGVVNGERGPRVGTVTNLSFRGQRGEVLVAALDLEGVCVSAGAACSSGLAEPSPVLRALYPDEPWRAESALRLSLGPETTAAEVSVAVEGLSKVLARSP